MINTLEYKGVCYPSYIAKGKAASYVIPFAEQFCKGNGYDIGGLLECYFPGSKHINITNGDGLDAYHLPEQEVDYIFSSHTLEHLTDYVSALLYWQSKLKSGGILFLYLPHPDMEYWLPQNNRKHFHQFYPEIMVKLLRDMGFKNIFTSQRDLYWSFAVVGEKA